MNVKGVLFIFMAKDAHSYFYRRIWNDRVLKPIMREKGEER
jgi:hypothetical protein